MADIRGHTRYPELTALADRRRRLRQRVLELWPEDTAPEDLSLNDQKALEAAENEVHKADAEYTDLYDQLASDVADGKFD